MLTGSVLHYFDDQAGPATVLGRELGVSGSEIAVRQFPDGESLVRVKKPSRTAILYCSLDRPNRRLVELMLAASALRDSGATRIVLVSPYLCYMRQDIAFHTGEAVSQRTVSRLLAGLADRVVTVDPHLHRTTSLEPLFAPTPADALCAAPMIGELLAGTGLLLLAGPDAESRQWVEKAAAAAGTGFAVGHKSRQGDRSVMVDFADPARITGRTVVLVDDLVSTGATLCAAARALRKAGAETIEAVVVHALFSDDDHQAMRQAGIARIRSTDSVAHPTNAIGLAPLLAASLALEVGQCQ